MKKDTLEKKKNKTV